MSKLASETIRKRLADKILNEFVPLEGFYLGNSMPALNTVAKCGGSIFLTFHEWAYILCRGFGSERGGKLESKDFVPGKN